MTSPKPTPTAPVKTTTTAAKVRTYGALSLIGATAGLLTGLVVVGVFFNHSKHGMKILGGIVVLGAAGGAYIAHKQIKKGTPL